MFTIYLSLAIKPQFIRLMKYYNLKFKTENLQRKVELDTCTQN